MVTAARMSCWRPPNSPSNSTRSPGGRPPPTRRPAPWREHVVAEPVECVVHGIQAADIDGDGRPDIVYAEMHQGKDPDEVGVYFNRGGKWEKQVIATTGSHDIQVADLDGDGDPDLFGANWSGDFTPIQIWINERKRP